MGGAFTCLGVHLQLSSINYAQFFIRPGEVYMHPVHPLAIRLYDMQCVRLSILTYILSDSVFKI